MADEELKNLEQQLQNATRSLTGTTKALLKNAKTEKERNAILSQSKKLLEERKKLQKDQNELTEDLNALYEEQAGELEDLTESYSASRVALGRFADGLDKAGFETKFSLTETIKGVKDTMLDLSRADKRVENAEQLTKGLDGIKVFGMKLSDAARVIDFNASMFKTLAMQGATFGGSIIKLREAATDANMPILQFTDFIGKNSAGLARLFGSVDDSIPRITAFTRRLRDLTMSELSQFGLNLEETAELGATVLELERARGNADKLRSMDLARITVDYTKNLVELSKLTGASVDELNAQNQALSVNGAFQAQLANMAPEEANRIQNMVAGLTEVDPALGQLAQELIALGQPISDTSRNLSVMSGGAIQDAILAFTSGSGSMTDLMNSLGAVANSSIKGAEAFGDASFAGANFGEALSALVKLGRGQTSSMDEQMSARDAETQAMIKAKDAIEELEASFEKAGTAVLRDFMALGGISATVEAMQGLSDYLQNPKGNIFGAAYDAAKNAIRVTSVFVGKAIDTGKEFVMKGEDGMNFVDNIKSFFGKSAGTVNPVTNLTPEQKEIFAFGQPISNIGNNAVSMLGGTSPDGPNIPTTPTEMTGSNTVMASNRESGVEALIEEMKKNNAALNTVVTIMDKTEKNTKDTKIAIANSGGSLV